MKDGFGWMEPHWFTKIGLGENQITLKMVNNVEKFMPIRAIGMTTDVLNHDQLYVKIKKASVVLCHGKSFEIFLFSYYIDSNTLRVNERTQLATIRINTV
jgi:hypothetical protein